MLRDDAPDEHYEVRCPLHGSIPFNSAERALIDHEVLQRLRRIRQLGMADLVYPSATHHRFAHSLGAMHLAGRIWDRILRQPGSLLIEHLTADERRYCRGIVRKAALLHDIGHPPFSHALEEQLPLFSALHPAPPADWYLRPPAADKKASHEDYTVALLHYLSLEDPPILNADEAQDIAACVHQDVRPSDAFAGSGRAVEHRPLPLLRSIVSGEIDADRMDYLRRDALFAGVPYGQIELERLIQSFNALETADGLELAIHEEAVQTYEHFIMARYHMTVNVYYHKTVLVMEHCLREAIRSGELPFQISPCLEKFLTHSEDQLRRAWQDPHDREGRWTSHLRRREPPKMLLSFHSDALQSNNDAKTNNPADLHLACDAFSTKLDDAGIHHVLLRRELPVSRLDETTPGPSVIRKAPFKGSCSLYDASNLLKHFNRHYRFEAIYLLDRTQLPQAKQMMYSHFSPND